MENNQEGSRAVSVGDQKMTSGEGCRNIYTAGDNVMPPLILSVYDV